jgi:hypothetical protein
MKASSKSLIDKGYRVTSLNLTLNPHWRGSGYSEYIEDDGSLHAGRGEVRIYGDKSNSLDNLTRDVLKKFEIQ